MRAPECVHIGIHAKDFVPADLQAESPNNVHPHAPGADDVHQVKWIPDYFTACRPGEANTSGVSYNSTLYGRRHREQLLDAMLMVTSQQMSTRPTGYYDGDLAGWSCPMCSIHQIIIRHS